MHVLRQQTFDIDCPSKKLGKEIHAQLGTLLEQHFYPKLEALFNAYAPKGHSWSIDLLELELPDITAVNWKKGLIERSLTQVETYLKINRPIVVNSNNPDGKSSLGSIMEESANAEALFFCFLETGVIPVNVVSNKLEALLAKIEITDRFVNRLFEHFKSASSGLARWVLGVPDSFKERVITFITPSIVSFYKEPQAFFTKETMKRILVVDSSTMHQWLEFIYWSATVYCKTGSKNSHFIRTFIELSKKHCGIDISINVVAHLAEALKNAITIKGSEMQTDLSIFIKDLEKMAASNDSVFMQKDSFREISEKEETEEVFGNVLKDILGDELYIDNAGLILLHPFLPSLFEQLGLCEKENWKDTHSQHKAVLLTQYLITGQKNIFENELILNKILCGLPLDSVINTKVKITKKDKSKCFSLLEAVLEYWKPMSKSSIEALQETFLQRNGKLEIGNNYELWIEEKGYDILLEQLPWGIGIIRTPWMDGYLTCNWA